RTMSSTSALSQASRTTPPSSTRSAEPILTTSRFAPASAAAGGGGVTASIKTVLKYLPISPKRALSRLPESGFFFVLHRGSFHTALAIPYRAIPDTSPGRRGSERGSGGGLQKQCGYSPHPPIAARSAPPSAP